MRIELETLDQDYEEFALPVSGGMRLSLRRRRPAASAAGAVLLMHGGNTNGHIYSVPDTGLAGYLHERGFDVWLLDWRASNRILAPILSAPLPRGQSASDERKNFTLDTAVDVDIDGALSFIREKIGDVLPITAVGYCMSAGALSMAAARGICSRHRVNHVVLIGLGLFYKAPWNGWIKAEDYLLERSLHSHPKIRAIDPNAPDKWPPPLLEAYDVWPRTWLPARRTKDDDMLHRLSFMVGQPWSTERLHEDVQGDVRPFFGPLHLGIYLHSGQMVRRGYAAGFDAPEHVVGEPNRGAVRETDLNPEHFHDSMHVTLLGGQNNGLWHRNSLDLMYDWLRSYTSATCRKRILPGYNLHELLWGARAKAEVYPIVLDGCARLSAPLPTHSLHPEHIAVG